MKKAPTDQPPIAAPPSLAESVSAALLLVVVLVFLGVHTVLDPDVWFHMAFGRWVIENGAIPAGDVLSFTAPGAEWISSGWLSSILLHIVYTRAQEGGLVALVLVAGLAGWCTLLITAQRWGVRPLVAMLLIAPALAAGAMRLTPRPELGSLLSLALLLAVLLESERLGREGRDRAGTLVLLAVPFVMALWANLHAGVLIGAVVVALYAANQLATFVSTKQQVALHRALLSGTGCAAWLANPYGWGLTALAGKIKSIENVDQFIMEWRPLLSGAPAMATVVVAAWFTLLILAAAVIISQGRRTPPWLVVVAVLFVYMAFSERRHLGISSVALVAACIPALGAWCARPRRALQFASGVGVAASAAVIVLQVLGAFGTGGGMPRVTVDDSLLPASATRFMQQNRPPANLFNDYGPGGYLTYHLGPETKVFIDGRLDVYPPEVWKDFLGVMDGRFSIDEAVPKYNLRSVLLYTRGAPMGGLAWYLSTHPEWGLCYYDDNYSLFVLAREDSMPYLATHGYQMASPYTLDRVTQAAADPMQRGVVEIEVARARAACGDCAKALIVAAVAAGAAGDPAERERLLAEAKKKDPSVRVSVK